MLVPYEGELDNEETVALEYVQSACEIFPEKIEIAYGQNLDEDDAQFVMRPGQILINRERTISLDLIPIGYATTIAKDVDVAQKTIEAYGEDV